LSDDNLVKTESCPPIPITNNYESGNQKELSISISQTSSLVPVEHEDFIPDNFFHKTKPHDDYVDLLQLCVTLLDRPIGIAMHH
jgi:hypothetical protein